MIRKIEIKNIQSHENSELEFCNGINAIVGSSNNGKSAILRALNWAIKNRPLGTDILLSHWAVNEKGNQNDEMSIKVTDDVGNILIRRRTKEDNQYIINGKELNVVKSDVPEEVDKFFRLSDTNIQRQQDSPFLLSLSSGEVAKYFNKTVKLDIIDKILTEAESRKRKIKSEKEILEQEIQNLEEKLSKYDWTKGIDVLINKYKRVQDRNCTLSVLCDSIKNDIDTFKEQKIFNINKQKELMAEIENVENESSCNKMSIDSLSNNLTEIKKLSVYDLGKQKTLADKITDILKGSRLKYDAENLKEDIEEIILCNKDIQDCNSEIDELWQEMPDVCPICGNPLNINKKC